MNNNIIKTEHLVKEFKSGEGTLRVLQGITLEIKKGEILSIVGPSGAGKSTLLHLLGLLDKPTSGKIFFKDQDLSSISQVKSAKLRNTSFGFVFQFYHLIPELSVLENTILPFMINHPYFSWIVNKNKIQQKGRSLLEKLGLGNRLNHKVTKLSGGESQRVAIARALIADPEIIFCDEPTGNLDQKTSKEIQNIIWEMNQNQGQTFVIVTHDENLAKKAHTAAHLIDGIITDN